jgi:hypothetical protein
MIAGLFFSFWRFMEIITLIPTIGMLSWFVHNSIKQVQLTPSWVLVLFITSVLACAWAIWTLFAYRTTRSSALFVAFVDVCFVGAFIAGVVVLRWIQHDNCATFHIGSVGFNLGNLGYWGYNGGTWTGNINKNCAMLKASWAFGIMNTIMFAFTAFLALFIHRRVYDEERVVVEKRRRSTHHSSRHRHRRSY